jgi:hypothetical protein
MSWQSGVLKCDRKTCQDVRTIGERDREIAKILQTLPSSDEGKPDKILTEPGLKLDLDEITV